MQNKKYAISFVGTGNYQETCYTYEGDEVCTALFPVAVRRFFPDYEPLILLTEEARQKHGEALVEAGFSEEQLVHIPSGKKEEELWEIFDCISQRIPAGSELVLDVTHGFRTQPIILLAVVEFLKSARDITISHIVYGAYEARDAQGKAPVWDLRTFLDLMDWAAATRRFLETGDASLLQRSLRIYHGRTHKEERADDARARHLRILGDRLGEFSEALRLNRVYEFNLQKKKGIIDVTTTVEKALSVIKKIHESQEFVHVFEARPLILLLGEIEKMLRKLNYPSEKKGLEYLISREGLCMQVAVIEQLLCFRLYQQAITVARECMVNYYMVYFFSYEELDFNSRKDAEENLNHKAYPLQKKEEYKDDAKYKEYVSTLSAKEKHFYSLWNNISRVRNDINHAGMRSNPESVEDLQKHVREYASELVDLVRGEVGCHAD